MRRIKRPIYVCLALLFSCTNDLADKLPIISDLSDLANPVAPAIVSDPVQFDSDDPAIWIDAANPANSLVLGTDKGKDSERGGLYVFDLEGNEIKEKTISDLKRPNNVDVAYGLMVRGCKTDIAVVTERKANAIRVFSLPDMRPLDNGGIQVFEGEGKDFNEPMGIALFTAQDGNIYAIISRSEGPEEDYLWQYQLMADNNGHVSGKLVRKFGKFSGRTLIEAVAVDNEAGYVYYSDERYGIRKYYAHPDSSGIELAVFGTEDFKKDIEGISIYKFPDGTGYILVSDQQADIFRVFPREGAGADPHHHPLIESIATSTNDSDGSEVTSIALPGYSHGLFVAMSNDKTFQYYRWEDMADGRLRIR
jgi:3-phytase